MRFTKMQGAGNDYVYVDCFAQGMPDDPAALARAVADRHFGVGGDGLILICRSQVADARMRMFNADGSEAEMCGNGVRCVAKYVYDHGLARRPRLRIETGRGVLTLDVETAGDRVRRVRVDMGEPILPAAQIPAHVPGVRGDQPIVDYVPLAAPPAGGAGPQPAWSAPAYGLADSLAESLRAAGVDDRLTCVSMGNPHAVWYCRDAAAVPLEQVGPVLETLPLFPKRINVHFVQVHSPDEVTMRTWERGSGVTLACGTGASAVCVAGALAGRSARRILAHLPGGDLELAWSDDNHVYMTGPAVEVFHGEWTAPT